MAEKAGNHIADFQQKVCEHFESLKIFKEAHKLRLADKMFLKFKAGGLRDKFWGCIFIPIFTLLDIFGTKTLQKHSLKYKDFENEQKANELLAEDEIQKILCLALRNAGKTEILTEEKMVKTVVAALGNTDMRNKFQIPFNEHFFAFLSYQLLQKGLENYCQQIS